MGNFNKNVDNINITPVESEEELENLSSDCVISVIVRENKMSAFINIKAPVNQGAKPTLDSLMEALKNDNVIYGINMEKLEEIAKTLTYDRNILIAQGKVPINGINGSFTLNFISQKSLKPKEKADGSVDYHDLGIVENVKKDQVLCTIKHPTEGIDGMTVCGLKIFATKGKAVPNFSGKNTKLSEDGITIYSTIDGQVDFNGLKINVNDTFYINDNVDNSTGNVNVNGNVVVRGMVLPGFHIEAGGNIEINGMVESAIIKAGGNIVLRGGITGSELYCNGNLSSRFIENCKVVVKGDIKAEYILVSNINCGKKLALVGEVSKIVGGFCIAGQNIEARTIGSAAGVETVLNIATNTENEKAVQKKNELSDEIIELGKKIDSLKSVIFMFKKLEAENKLTSEKKTMFNETMFSYKTFKEIIEKKKSELDEIYIYVDESSYGKIICSGTICPGTKVYIGDAKLFVKDNLINTSLYLKDGEICKGQIF